MLWAHLDARVLDCKPATGAGIGHERRPNTAQTSAQARPRSSGTRTSCATNRSIARPGDRGSQRSFGSAQRDQGAPLRIPDAEGPKPGFARAPSSWRLAASSPWAASSPLWLHGSESLWLATMRNFQGSAWQNVDESGHPSAHHGADLAAPGGSCDPPLIFLTAAGPTPHNAWSS